MARRISSLMRPSRWRGSCCSRPSRVAGGHSGARSCPGRPPQLPRWNPRKYKNHPSCPPNHTDHFIIAHTFIFSEIFRRLDALGKVVVMTTTKESPTYAERMEAFPDVGEDLEKYRAEEQQRNFTLYFTMMRALHKGRTSHVRKNSWGHPEPHRTDGSPMTKPSRASRAEASHKRSKAAGLARAKSR